MWKCALVAAIAVGCSNPGGESARTQDPAAAAAALARVPRVDTAEVLAADDGRPPPVLVLIDDAGGIQIAAAATWNELGSRDVRIGARTTKIDIVGWVVRESMTHGRTPTQIVATVATVAAAPSVIPPVVDPPPPPADDDDEGSEESGGTSAMVNLDEEEPDDVGRERLAREAREAAMTSEEREVERQRVVRMNQLMALGRRTGSRGATGFSGTATEAASRLATVVGEVLRDGRFEREPQVAILASPRAKATALIRAVTETEGLIAVAHRGGIRPLRLSFVSEPRAWLKQRWVEVRVSTRGIALEAAPEVARQVSWEGAAIDRVALTSALDAARASRKLDAFAPIDVLVEPDVDVQRLVDLLVALDLLGVRMIGLGEAPPAGSPAAAQRGRRIPEVLHMPVYAQGDLAKAVINKMLATKRPEIRACYETALATKPDLKGTVTTQLYIMPTGNVAQASGSGVDPDLATCIAAVEKSIVFPHPKGGGGVQVNASFVVRP